MELNNEFEVGVPLSQAWQVLTDLERIAPCMPGAELREVEGDEYRGVVKVKVGPISAEYRGAARFLEKDDPSHRAVLRAEGREARGQGNANATITATLESSADATKVSLVTDLQITGKVAQFGRGVLADVSNKLLGQFVENLETTVLSGQSESPHAPDDGSASSPASSSRSEDERSAPEGESPRQSSSGDSEVATTESYGRRAAGDASGNGAVRRIESSSAEPVDLFEVAGAPVARRVVPVVGGMVAVLVVFAILRRLFRRTSGD